MRNVVEDPTSKSTKIILLKTEVESLEFVKKEAVGVVKHTLELNYDCWSVDEILKAILPEGDEMPSSFTQVGHIGEELDQSVVQGKLKAYNLDGRHFVEMAVHDLHVALNSQSNTTNSSSPAEGQTVFKTFKHFVMNLPATSIEFLGNVFGRLREITSILIALTEFYVVYEDAFKGLYKDKGALITNPDDQLPMIHCHCFSKSEEPEKDIVKRVVTALGYPLQPGYKIHFVRKVAPNKDMFCISFKLDTNVAFGSAKRKIDGSYVAVQNDEYDDNKVAGIAKKVKVDIE
ncbi:6117_t:CDS:2 [Paraglomus brasilianum]|uniref:6117_t:CDS:1 n=1 Tax=Paraglomus brasilianum TaxID=144538 RepID=A0A9N9D322_9GLOM|nr:6117_t:CDS:2 [Paraglomus brasilianum]